MRTRKRFIVPSATYFLTVNVYQRREIFIIKKWLDLFINILKWQRSRYHFQLHEFVIMPDHYHFIVTPPKCYNISHTMQHINGSFAKYYNKAVKHQGRVFQPDFYDHVIRSEEDFVTKANYIHQNPVKAGLVAKITDYPWSSARNRLNGDDSPMLMDDMIS